MINRANSGYCICGHTLEQHINVEDGVTCLGDRGRCDCDQYEEAPVIGFIDEDAVNATGHKRNTD